MTVESATYIDELVATNPAAGDGAGEGDDHLRLLKDVLQNTLPNLSGAVTGTDVNMNEAIEPQTALELANGVTPTNIGYAVGDARRYGVVEGSGADQSVALQAALNSGYPVQLPPGSISFASTLTVPDSTCMKGAGSEITILTYTGAGTAFESSTPLVRTYSWNFSAFDLIDGGTGLIGFDMQNVSTSSFSDIRVRSFATNIKITGDTGGWAVYNRFYNVYSGSATTYNWHIGAKGSNATTLIACRSNGASITPVGMYIADSNDVHIMNCQIEGQTNTGIQIRDTGAYPSPGQIIISECRFENNTTYAVDIDTGFSGVMLLHNIYYSTGGTILDNGTATQIRGRQNTTSDAGEKAYSTMSATNNPAYTFTRTGVSTLGQEPGVRIEDTGTGDHITLEVETPTGLRASGARAFHTTKSGTETFGIAPSGEICTNQYSATGTATLAIGTVPVYDTAGALIGYVQVYQNP